MSEMTGFGRIVITIRLPEERYLEMNDEAIDGLCDERQEIEDKVEQYVQICLNNSRQFPTGTTATATTH